MGLLKINKNSVTRGLLGSRGFANALKSQHEEYTATPQYPPILDLSLKSKLKRKKNTMQEEVKLVKTVEEKQIKLNMPRYYGFPSNMIKEDYIPYNSLSLSQHITKTHLIVNNNLPDFYKTIEVDDLVNKLKNAIEEMILIEIDEYQKAHDLTKGLAKEDLENIISSSVSKQMNRIIVNKLSKTHPHLSKAQVSEDPRIECSWYAGGMNAPASIKKNRQRVKWMKVLEDDPIDRLMVYVGNPNLTLRSDIPLNPIIPYSEADNPELEVPYFQYDPRVLGTVMEHRSIANVPGFWPGDPSQFSLMSYHKRGHMLTRQSFQDAEDDKEALHYQGILASFGWLSSLANHLGFTTFNDITYPLVTQTIITNGKIWSFYVYQLNTLFLQSENAKRNICWATNELKLFEDIQDGKIIGFNEDVLKYLVKFYANTPESRLGVNLTPYLSSEEQVVADYEDPDKRAWLEREYKYLTSHRPRYRLMDEVYSWEKIYKIDNKTRFMDKRLRPFELFTKPQKRRLDDRVPHYIPRKLRPDLPRSKGRYVKEYFP